MINVNLLEKNGALHMVLNVYSFQEVTDNSVFFQI